MVFGLDILIGLAFDTAFLILVMHLTGRWFGIDFGPLKAGISKVMAFLLITGVLWKLLGIVALPINLVIWLVGFKIAFNLDSSELWIFVCSFIIGSTLLRFALVMVLAS